MFKNSLKIVGDYLDYPKKKYSKDTGVSLKGSLSKSPFILAGLKYDVV